MFVKKYSLVLFVGSVLLAFSTIGLCNENSYRAEAEFGFSQTDGDDEFESKLLDLSFAYYLSPVSITNKPYAEAEFLERAGAIGVAYGQHDTDTDFASSDGPIYGFGFQYAEKNLPVYFYVFYGKAEEDVDFKEFPRATGSSKFDTLSIGFGYYLSDDSTISFGYTQNESKFEAFNPDVPPEFQTIKFETDSDNYTIGYKKVTLLDQGRAFNLEADFVRSSYDDNDGESGDNNEISFLVDYYTNAATSFGFGFATNSGDDKSDEGETLSLRFKFFASPTIFLSAAYEDFSAEQDNNDDQTFKLGVGGRF